MTANGRRPEHASRGAERRGSRRSGERRLGPPPDGLFRDIVLAPDREQVPDARPVVSWSTEDEPDFRREVERRLRTSIDLVRRGVEHGTLAELEPEGLVGPRPRRRRREALESERWCAGQPILLPGLAAGVRPKLLAADVAGLRQKLALPSGLAQWLESVAPRIGPRFRALATGAELFDPERDVARVEVNDAELDDSRAWVKVSRLSTHPEDASLRVRVSFGREGDDDASADEARQVAVGALGRALLPGAAAVEDLEELRAKLERHVGGRVYGAQQIAYWNAPNGGARFHHDAFTADDVAVSGQRGVVYAQLTGRTVWLALSIEDLAARLREVAQWIEDGDLAELREAMDERWGEALAVLSKRAETLGELARPNCGIFTPIVDAPQFTTFLADAGHALVLHPGDVLLLPNHGLGRTAMHSVFCASDEPGYALSIAVRAG